MSAVGERVTGVERERERENFGKPLSIGVGRVLTIELLGFQVIV